MTNISDATTLTSLFFNTSNTTPHPDSTVHPQPIDPALRTCNYFVISTNKTVVFDFNNHYGGKAYFWQELRLAELYIKWFFSKICRRFWNETLIWNLASKTLVHVTKRGNFRQNDTSYVYCNIRHNSLIFRENTILFCQTVLSHTFEIVYCFFKSSASYESD